MFSPDKPCLCTLRYPSGRWGFVGRVDSRLTGVYQTQAEAIAAARSIGAIITQICRDDGRTLSPEESAAALATR